MRLQVKPLSRTAEILLGLSFLFGAFNGLIYFMGFEAPIPVNPDSELAVALAKTRYIFLLQKIVELVAAILLLLGKMRFAALIALAPIVACIVLYHLFDDLNWVILITLTVLYILALSGHQRSLLLFFRTG
ncbi:hypothetical protein ACTJIJ_18985 [Niabella sp. 22666]|uniref:hypothetical protein n=1 Tax=Niabella sp. 22666 TaxID=3453954 RepID=UPI003F86B6DE